MRLQEVIERTGVQFGTSGARGLVDAMSDEVCYAYAAAFLASLEAPATTLLLGHDLRPSSPRIAGACARACHDAGWRVVYAGALPTPALAYFGMLRGWPVIVVTGSHIPFDRNGIKFYGFRGEISKADEHSIATCTVHVPESQDRARLPALDVSVRDAFVHRYVDFFGSGSLAGVRIAIYEHSSVARDVLGEVLRSLGAKVQALGRTDSFVPIDTEAVRAEDVQRAGEWAQANAFDAILSTDGDADRPLIGDESGRWIRGDAVGLLTAQYLQAHTVVTPVSSNTAVERCGSFANVRRSRIGSPYVIEGMQDALLPEGHVTVGYEANGGFLLGSDVTRQGRRLSALPTRDSFLPMISLLMFARERNCKLSQLVDMLPKRYTASDRLTSYATEQSARLMDALRLDPIRAASVMAPNSGSIDSVNDLDGLRVVFSNGDIVHLRPSGNAPELRCYAEADNEEHAKELCSSCLSRVG